VKVEIGGEKRKTGGVGEKERANLGRELGADELELVSGHEAGELLADAVARGEGAGVEEVVVGPLLVLPVGLPRVVCVEQRQVVAWFILSLMRSKHYTSLSYSLLSCHHRRRHQAVSAGQRQVIA
jgi:hypothetical protein